MPINNDIYIVFNRSLHHLVNQGKMGFRRLLVSKRIVNIVFCTAIGIIIFDTHGITEYVDFKVVNNPRYDCRIIIGNTGRISPEKAYTAKHDLLVVLGTDYLAAASVKCTVVRNRAHFFGGCSRRTCK